MPLILAIEPDRRQAALLTGVLQRRVTAELVLVDTTERALDAIGSRVPDLVLVPTLLSPQDDAALAAAVRVIAAAAQVQMLTIPVLGALRRRARPSGVLSGLRRGALRSAEPDGCDPMVFAAQVASYLEQAAAERANLLEDAEPLERPTPAALPAQQATDEATIDEATIDEATIDEATIAAPRPTGRVDEDVWSGIEEWARGQLLAMTPTSPGFPGPTTPTGDSGDKDGCGSPSGEELEGVGETSDVFAIDLAIETTADAGEGAGDKVAACLAAEPGGAPMGDAAGVRLPPGNVVDERAWLAVEEAFRARFLATAPEAEPLRAAAPAPLTDAREESDSAMVEPVAVEPMLLAAAPASSAVPAKGEREWVELIESLRQDVERRRVERVKPTQNPSAPRPSRSGKIGKSIENEWGLFDPDQCGFAALLAKLEEVTGAEKPYGRE